MLGLPAASVSAYIVDRDLAELLAELDAEPLDAEQLEQAGGVTARPAAPGGGSPAPDPHLPWAAGHGPGG